MVKCNQGKKSMTLNDMIELLAQIANDMDTHTALYANFKTFASDCPISGARETAIVEEYLDTAVALEALYREICKATAQWITQQ